VLSLTERHPAGRGAHRAPAFGDGDLAFGEADLAQRLLHELVTPAPAPSSIVVGTATGIAALAAALGVKRVQ